MSELTWDEPGLRYWHAGVSHGVFYPAVARGYGKGIAWSGLTGITESPSGADVVDLYADDAKYGSLRAAENFGGSISAYTAPKEFYNSVGQVTVDDEDGVVLGQQPRKAFGLSYRTIVGSDTDPSGSNYIIHIIYGATAGPASRSHSTLNENPDVEEISWEFNANPASITVVPNVKPTAKMDLDTRKLSPIRLRLLESILYGTDGTDPRLPTPDEVLIILTRAFYLDEATGILYYMVGPEEEGYLEATMDEDDVLTLTVHGMEDVSLAMSESHEGYLEVTYGE